MEIRKAQERDIPGIEELLVQVCLVHHMGRPDLFQYGKQKYSSQQLKELLADPLRPIFVALDKTGKVIAHAFCIHQQKMDHNVLTPVKTFYIDDICVHENYRGSGVGKQIYNFIQTYAKEHGYYNLTLNVWSFNEAALRFYENCGLTPQKIGLETIL